MPGSVSDAYDPEFGTADDAALVRDEITEVRDIITTYLGDPELRNIVKVCRGKNEWVKRFRFTDRELRILRFCLNRSLETI